MEPGWHLLTWLGALVVLGAVAILLLDAYIHRDADYLCWIPERHPWHEGCWQTRPTTTEETQ